MLLFNIVLDILANAVSQEIEIKGIWKAQTTSYKINKFWESATTILYYILKSC